LVLLNAGLNLWVQSVARSALRASCLVVLVNTKHRAAGWTGLADQRLQRV
jgi:hypothetical protein